MTGFLGFDAQRRPIVGCFDCGHIPVEIPRKGMNDHAKNALREHNGMRHPGRKVKHGALPRRDLGLVDW